MTTDYRLAADAMSWVDTKNGVVDRKIFFDLEIYQLEMERVFARAWLFMCHESQIPNPGDFFLNFMGEDRVIVVRNNEGGISVLVNSCRHRGNAVCRAEEGHASSFMCTYHGWTFDLQGKLVGVPGFKEVYHEELDRENWGLIKAAQVESYKGFVFATMDPTAPNLYEYLNESGRFGLDMLADQGDMVIIGGVMKWTMQCNWKFPADNTADFSHGLTSHPSAYIAVANDPKFGFRPLGNSTLKERNVGSSNGRYQGGYAVLGEYGHVAGMSYLRKNWEEMYSKDPAEAWRFDAETRERLGPLKSQASGCMTNIFPNLFVPMAARQVAIRMPKGPTTTEIWFFTFVDKNASPEVRELHRYRSGHQFGAAGLWEQDDGENWDQSTRGVRGVISGRYPLNYQMNLGRGEIIQEEDGPAHVEQFVNENYQLWQYRAWAELMAAESWADWKANHSRPQGTV
ncbi:MAG: SRPBCC family protein [Dehalococcoidia bacterium]